MATVWTNLVEVAVASEARCTAMLEMTNPEKESRTYGTT
jgi:hypothetical protein